MSPTQPDPHPGATAATTALLARHGLETAVLQPIAGDASPRAYFRLHGHGLILMQQPDDAAGFASWLRVARHLTALGLSAPQARDADIAAGVALIEDFGERTYTACLSAGDDETALYQLALDVLLHLHHEPRSGDIAQPPYDMQTLLREMDIFSAWFAPAVAPEGFDQAGFAEHFRSLWRQALAPVATRFETLVLRDFHVDNLMLLPERSGVRRCGLLDFQDAALGPCEYDLISLLQDARRDLAPGLETTLFSRYAANAPAHLGGQEAIRHRCALLAAQRHGRILGVFLRLWRRDGKPRYLAFLSRVARQFRTALQQAGLGEIQRFLDAELPGWEGKAAQLQT